MPGAVAPFAPPSARHCYQRNEFWGCYRNMGHFLCGVKRIKRFVNVHLHYIVSNLKRISKMSTFPPSLEIFLQKPMPVQSVTVSPQNFCVEVLQHGGWMSFLTELMPLIEP